MKGAFQKELGKRLTEEMDDWGLPDMDTCKRKFRKILSGNGTPDDLNNIVAIAIRLAVPQAVKSSKPQNKEQADDILKRMRSFRYDVARVWDDKVQQSLRQLRKGGKRRIPLQTRKEIALRIETLVSEHHEFKWSVMQVAKDTGWSLKTAYNCAREFGVRPLKQQR